MSQANVKMDREQAYNVEEGHRKTKGGSGETQYHRLGRYI